jgi:hypothetical protein
MSRPSKTSKTPEIAALHVEMWAIERVIPYARNARQIGQTAIAKVAASIKEFGWRQPIVVDSNGVIVVGHVRLLAAQSLKLSEVPVHVAGDLSAAQIKAYRLMDNRSHDEAKWDMQLAGLELADLNALSYDLKLTGFEKLQAREAFLQDWEEESSSTPSGKQSALEFRVIVDCTSESHQEELLDRFEGEGLKCRALIS